MPSRGHISQCQAKEAQGRRAQRARGGGQRGQAAEALPPEMRACHRCTSDTPTASPSPSGQSLPAGKPAPFSGERRLNLGDGEAKVGRGPGPPGLGWWPG